MELASTLQGHRVTIIYDEALGEGGGQLRALPLLRRLGVDQFTYRQDWTPYPNYRFCDYRFVHLDSASDFSAIEAPLCQFVDQETENHSLHDIALHLLASDAFTRTRPFILVTQPNFKLRGVTEQKSLAEARGIRVLYYESSLLRSPGVLASLGVDEAALTHKLLDATGNFVFLRAASLFFAMTGRRAESISQLLTGGRALVEKIGLWHLVEQIDEERLADPSTTQTYLRDCLRPWVEYGQRTHVKNRLLELLQVSRGD